MCASYLFLSRVLATWVWNSAMGALGYFQSRVQQIVEKHGKSAMFWDEFWVRATLQT